MKLEPIYAVLYVILKWVGGGMFGAVAFIALGCLFVGVLMGAVWLFALAVTHYVITICCLIVLIPLAFKGRKYAEERGWG